MIRPFPQGQEWISSASGLPGMDGLRSVGMIVTIPMFHRSYPPSTIHGDRETPPAKEHRSEIAWISMDSMAKSV